MKLEQQVVSLELAKKLKELGVKQESLVEWRRFYSVSGEFSDWFLGYSDDSLIPDETCAAFTVAELGEILPMELELTFQKKIGLLSKKHGWFIKENDSGFVVKHVKEADARAKMLIYLIENDLIKI